MKNDDMATLIDAMFYSMTGENPSKAIENQEKRGQQSVVRNQRLPKKQNEHRIPYSIEQNGVECFMKREEKNKIITQNNIEYTKQIYTKMGIVIIDEYDDLFWNVELPKGWEIKATNHSMWNDLFDDKGRKRATFFYKAALYDRDSFINFNTRFSISVSHIADINSSGYEIWGKSDYQGIVKDSEKIIFSTERVSPTGNYVDDKIIQHKLREQLLEYMNEHYPNYEDILSYWD